jgi:hypothetical protein
VAIIKHPTEAEIAKGYDDYARALGLLVHASNSLQDYLGKLYNQIVKGDTRIAQAVWHVINSDRTQRAILRAALNSVPEHIWEKRLPKARKEIDWLICEADDIANDRNVAVHTPCVYRAGEVRSEVHPLHALSQVSKQLANKHVIDEFEFFTKTAEGLTEFAIGAIHALAFNSASWPEKPKPPVRVQRPTPKT